MKIIHTGDWHLGAPRSPYKDGVNLRTQDTIRCLDKLAETAREQHPDLTVVSGDIFDVGKVWSDRCCTEIVTAVEYINKLQGCSGDVIVMRGTPNHDGNAQFRVLKEMFSDAPNVHIVDRPMIIDLKDVSVGCIPGFDMAEFSANHPDLSKEERNEAITEELANIVIGTRAQRPKETPFILMAHYTVPGANIESGQVTMLNQFEPVITQEALQAADYDLVALGHIHRPQQLDRLRNTFYCGGINTGNFNDEGQERGFWIHNLDTETKTVMSEFVETPYREFLTLKLDNQDITEINLGDIKEVAMRRWICDNRIFGRIVRVHYSCTEDNNKALNRALLSKQLTDDGAFMVWEILPETIDEFANRTELNDATDPEENLIQYLKEKDVDPERINDLVLKARPIIQQAQARMTTTAYTGTFEPVEISVRNYRNYVEETFSFEDISFCTINGVNGSGKSSLFMDAIIDCLYEEPREGEKTGWLRNDEKARSGSIMFTFRIGEHIFRVTRTRQRSGKGTLDISELVEGTWEGRSCERFDDTQKKILQIIGMDSMTFKSCALIMQDQYGLFLQALPEDRVKVLGTLLGLDVYRYMEKAVIEKGHEFGARNRDLKNQIEIHAKRLTDLGSPDEELASLADRMKVQRAEQKALQVEKDQKTLELNTLQEAAERKRKLESTIVSLSEKIQTAKDNSAVQQSIIDASDRILGQKADIAAHIQTYNLLLENEKKLAAESALYASKKEDAARLREQEASEKANLSAEQLKLTNEQEKLDAINAQLSDEDGIRKEAEDYEKVRKLYHEQIDLQGKYMPAKQRLEEEERRLDNARAAGTAEIERLNEQLASLTHRASMLKDSGCVEPEKAQCRFLADAREAQDQISGVEESISSRERKMEAEMSVYQKYIDQYRDELDGIPFDRELMDEYRNRMAALEGTQELLRELERKKSEISLLSASIDYMQGNIASITKRLNTLTSEAVETEQERNKYQAAYDERLKTQAELEKYTEWLEREKELPLAEERKSTATARLAEIAQETASLTSELKDMEEDLKKATITDSEIDNARAALRSVNDQLADVETQIDRIQIRTGALQQRAEQIKEITEQISGIRKEQLAAAKETADYDVLKMAFAQSGVPHQIVRSIIPTLTSTANSILGQMTGGKMGVEFRLERMQKNGKEKTALDIYIEEGAQAPLPYLSKSGGEKVKASLSVILALAEIKSSSIGMQLGFIAIDEPPFLDQDGIQAYCDALEAIQQRYPDMKVMAITHDPAMKARFPQSVDVVKTEEGSKVVY